MKNFKKFNPRAFLIQHWYYLLRLSPSYQLATRIRNGTATNTEQANLAKDFDLVLALYDDFGDVWIQRWEDWTVDKWGELFDAVYEVNPKVVPIGVFHYEHNENNLLVEENLRHHLEYAKQESVNTALVAISLKGSKSQILSEINRVVDKLCLKNVLQPETKAIPKPRYSCLITKLRTRAIETAIKVVLLKAANPSWKLWDIAIALKICFSQSQRIKESEKRKQELKAQGKKLGSFEKATDEKVLINAVIGRHLRYAFLLAENAARGKFPCVDEIYDGNGKKIKTSFDYVNIGTRMSEEATRRRALQTETIGT